MPDQVKPPLWSIFSRPNSEEYSVASGTIQNIGTTQFHLHVQLLRTPFASRPAGTAPSSNARLSVHCATSFAHGKSTSGKFGASFFYNRWKICNLFHWFTGLAIRRWCLKSVRKRNTFHALFLIAWLADGDSLICCIVMMGRQIAKMSFTFSLWGSLFLMDRFLPSNWAHSQTDWIQFGTFTPFWSLPDLVLPRLPSHRH